jgi:hypothetical protein
MDTNSANSESGMLPEISVFADLLQQQGVHAALEYLNHRTPHRYTGVFRFDGEMLRNEVLYDRNQTTTRQGNDVPLALTYCALVGRQEAPLTILDAATDPLAQGVDTSVISSACSSAMLKGRRMAHFATTTCNGAKSVPQICPCSKRLPNCFTAINCPVSNTRRLGSVSLKAHTVQAWSPLN